METKYQIRMFALCYLAWVSVHMQREFWSMSKKEIKIEHPETSATFFAVIDTSVFLTYGAAQFFTGSIGDAFNKKHILSLSFLVQAILFTLVGIGGTYELIHLWYFCSVFTLVGLVQSVDFPCMIGTIAAWTIKSSRGIVTGIWSTCASLGNIVGL
jgi:sugar phosphate permease